MDAMSSQEGGQGGFEETDSPGGPPWSQDICNPPYASWSLTYDGGANTVGNLTRVDLAGNITTKDGSAFGTYDDANKMTQIQGAGFAPSPDFDGNQKQIKSNNYPFTSTTLTYDSRNKLVTADTGTPEWAYRYDGFGRRVYRQNDIQTPTSRRHYLYAGDTLIGEIDDGVPTVAYTWGPDGVASRRTLTGSPNSRFYCYGPQGETRNLTDENQAVTSTYFYEAYGKPKGTVPTEYNPYRYGGKFGYYTDNEIQTLQVGARWYSPYLIRWMSRDPIHYRGGDNLSAYVMGNPVKYVDPSGLEPGDWQFHWKGDHGGPHFQIGRNGKQLRYDADTLKPLRHGSSLPSELSKNARKQLLRDPAYGEYLKWVERGRPMCGTNLANRAIRGIGPMILMLLPDLVRWLRFGDQPFEAERKDSERKVLCWEHPELCQPS